MLYMEPDDAASLLHTTIHGVEIRKVVIAETGNYMRFYNELYEAIVNNKPLPVIAQEGADVVRIIEAAYKSINQKKVVSF